MGSRQHKTKVSPQREEDPTEWTQHVPVNMQYDQLLRTKADQERPWPDFF